MSRLLHANYQASSEHYLPVVDWSAINATAPTGLLLPRTKLPSADIAVITWTSAEWSAMFGRSLLRRYWSVPTTLSN